MCYYNGVKVSRKELIQLLRMEAIVDEANEYMKVAQSGFVYEDYPVLKPEKGGTAITLAHAEWGLLPDSDLVRTAADVPDFRKRFVTLNAKGETLLKSPFYRDAAHSRRCLVLSSGFYDFRHFKPRGGKKEESYPYYVTLPGRSYFFMAGIWQPWTDRQTGETRDTFSIVTTDANPFMALVHNKAKRMPTILPEELAAQWIDDKLSERSITKLATHQLPADEMTAWTVSRDFIRQDDPAAPFVYPELPPLGEEETGPQPGEPLSLF